MDSDVDILVTYAESPSLFRHIFPTEEYLENVLGRDVDLIEERAVDPRIKADIDREKIYVTDSSHKPRAHLEQEGSARQSGNSRGPSSRCAEAVGDHSLLLDKRRWLFRVEDMIAEIEQSQEFVRDEDLESFIGNERTYAATAGCIVFIGDAAKGLPREFKYTQSEIPWGDLSAFADRLVQGDVNTDKAEVWQFVHEDLPPVLERLRQLLSSSDCASG